jgi:hypothetical protein
MVSHGTSLSLIYGTIFAAWVFAVAKGVLIVVLAGPRTLDCFQKPIWGGTFLSGNGNTTSLCALAIAAASARFFYKKLLESDEPGRPEEQIYGWANDAHAKLRSHARARLDERPRN